MRINCIPVELLSDQHLRAEWLELLLLPPYLARSLKSKKGLVLTDSIRYTLNTGHARFFYNKIPYVVNRYRQLGEEMRKRGFNINPQLSFDHLNLPKECYTEWEPNEQDQLVNLERIESRISRKPAWYTYHRRASNWQIFYQDYKQAIGGR